MEHKDLEFIPGIGNIRRMLTLPAPVVYKKKAMKSRGVSGPARYGVQTKLTPMQWFEAIFTANEKLAKTKKMTDLDLLAMWEKEFPDGWPQAKDGEKKRYEFLRKRLNKLRDYRKRFNRGELYKNQAVRIISWRYNEKGLKVEFADGITPLDPEREKWWLTTFREQTLKAKRIWAI